MLPTSKSRSLKASSPVILTCEPGWEAALADELQRVFPDPRPARAAAGWVVGEFSDGEPNRAPCVALCAQCLPNAQPIRASSISEWSRAVGERMIDGLAGHAGPWRLHVFGVYHDSGALRPRRCQLIRDKIGSLLQKKQRRLLRSLTAGDGPWLRGEALVQVGLPMPDTGFLSICDADLRFRLRRMVAPFCGGIAGIAADRRAPSRAFAKLIEAELRLGRRIEAGQTCVDLGSSPGSWAYVALERGARVLAVDRSPLRADLMAHPALAFVRGDAFGYRPAERVDWLLSDVIAPAERIIELLQTWVAERWCRRFCVTIKFRGTSDYAILEPLKSWLAAADVEFILRRLTNNKNEITAIGELPDDLADCRIEFPEN